MSDEQLVPPVQIPKPAMEQLQYLQDRKEQIIQQANAEIAKLTAFEQTLISLLVAAMQIKTSELLEVDYSVGALVPVKQTPSQ